MATYHLAIDIGASSGRHILGHLENGKLVLEEIYRFENFLCETDGALTWDIDHLVSEVKFGIKKCREKGKIPTTVAIDTWGVDYVLLDENKNEILPVVAYRDGAVLEAKKKVEEIVSASDNFKRNGIQPLNFNTVYQLYRDKLSGKLQNAKHCLMIPDYLSFKLTGVLKNEYTNATTGAIVNAQTKEIDGELLNLLGIPENLFGKLSMPCEKVGEFSKEFRNFTGFNSTVVLCASHDTASAVLACPLGEDGLYISSGTWSLIGAETFNPILTEEARLGGFTNEGGVEYRYRFLENIMGMWLFQNIRKNLDKKYTYDEMMQMAMGSSYNKRFDPNHSSLTAPENMLDAIKTLLGDGDLPLGDLLSSVYHSLAYSYNEAVKTIERLCNKEIKFINIVGGGSKDEYLNRLTSKYTGKKVITGLSEATATGNLLAQIIYCDKSLSVDSAREIVLNSFNFKENEYEL